MLMNKKRLVSLCALLLALMLVFSAVPVSAEVNAYVRDAGIGKINMRSGPATQYRVVAALVPYTLLEVLDVWGKWAHVRLSVPTADGVTEGYIYTDYIEYYTTDDPGLIPSTEVVYDWQNTSGQYNYPPITENTIMYVYTGNSGRLHLREYPSQSARSLGLFPNGTKVTVLNRSSVWAFVKVNSIYGFMMLTFLSSSQVQPVTPSSQAVIKYVNTGNSGRLHLRQYASQDARSLGLYPNGTMVRAVDLGNGWSHVVVNGMVGYMMTRFLSDTPPYNPDPYPGQYTIMYVYSPDGSKVDLRSGMSTSAQSLGRYANGTMVRVYYRSGDWAFVSVEGIVGYMQYSRLSTSPYNPPHPVNPIGTATVVHPNGSFVYLRSTRSTSSLDNVLAKVPSGARVTVYERDEWYSLIEYNGIYGYMVSHFLQYGFSPEPSPTPTGNIVRKMIVGGADLRSTREEGNANNIIMHLPHGTIVEILLTYPDEWRYIDYNGVRGYIHGPVVASVTGGNDPSPLMPVVPESPVIYYARVQHPNGSFVYLRYSRSSQDTTNVLAKVPSGSWVEVMEEYSSNWSKVRYNGIVGYMVSTYLVRNDGASPGASVPSVPLTPAQPSSTTAPASVPSVPMTPARPQNDLPSQTSGETRIVRGGEGGKYAYLRSSKDMNSKSNIISNVAVGTIVEVLEIGDGWMKVRVSNKVGYMASKYLKKY